MNLPRILIDALPNLTDAPGLIGSYIEKHDPSLDDRIIFLMVYLYETYPPETLM